MGPLRGPRAAKMRQRRSVDHPSGAHRSQLTRDSSKDSNAGNDRHAPIHELQRQASANDAFEALSGRGRAEVENPCIARNFVWQRQVKLVFARFTGLVHAIYGDGGAVIDSWDFLADLTRGAISWKGCRP